VVPEPVHQLQLLLTERCNLTCTHCAVPEEESPATHELTTEEWLDFLRATSSAGVDRFVLSGGEALLRADCLDIARTALELGAVQVVVVSNGTTLSSRTCAPLAALQRDWAALHLHVSLDGAFSSSHDLIRGPGTFDRTVRAMERLRLSEGRVDGIHTVVHRANLTELDDLVDLAREVGARTWTVFPLASLGRGRDLDHLRLHQAEWEDVLEKLARTSVEGLEIALMGPTMVDEWRHGALVPRFRGMHSRQAVVGPDGSIFTCPPLRSHELGWATEVHNGDGWAAVDARITARLGPSCPSCKYRPLCTGVEPGRFDAAGTSFGEPDEVVPVQLRSSVAGVAT
jgi:radical SAM protein with 4Fe4S-binding SPASM domain